MAHINPQLNAPITESANNSSLWEALFVLVTDVENIKEIAISNIYHHANDNSNEINKKPLYREIVSSMYGG